MSSHNDSRYGFLIDNTSGDFGQTNDGVVTYVRLLGSTKNSLKGTWDQFLTAQGFSGGHINDRMYAWLGSLGHTQASIVERWRSYWESAGVGVPSEYTIEYTSEYR